MNETESCRQPALGRKIIALCEDDEEIRTLLSAFFLAENFEVLAAADAGQLDRLLTAHPIDVVVLDWMLQGEDGFSVLKRLQAQGGPPVVMLTARDGDDDRIAGLETGAGAYVTKPFNPRVLLAHVRAALRASQGAPAEAPRLHVADLMIEPSARRVTCAGKALDLTAGEFDILLGFAMRPQRVLSRDHLFSLSRRRSMGAAFERAVDVQVSRLRAKLERAGSSVAASIQAVRNAGYILTVPVTAR